MAIVFMATVVRSEFEELVQVLSCGDNVLFCGLVHQVITALNQHQHSLHHHNLHHHHHQHQYQQQHKQHNFFHHTPTRKTQPTSPQS